MRNVILLFLLIVGWTTTVYAQNEQETIEVTGIVTDPKNEPLIGVNVTARNMPGFGAITDINGRYKIKVPNYSYLIFSYVGFTKQEIFIKDKKIINIVMAETKETVIDEVVVTGTGAQKKVTVTRCRYHSRRFPATYSDGKHHQCSCRQCSRYTRPPDFRTAG